MQYQTSHSAENNFVFQEPEVEVWRTDVTDEDREQAIEDEYEVLYSPDGLKVSIRLTTVHPFRLIQRT